MESRRRQFVVKAVPCFSDVSDMDVRFFGLPQDVAQRVSQACIKALNRIELVRATELRCTLDNSDVTVDIIVAGSELTRREPGFATLM